MQVNHSPLNPYNSFYETDYETEVEETASSTPVAAVTLSFPTTEQIREFIDDLFADEEKWLSLLDSSANGWCFYPSDELFDHFVQCKAQFEKKHPTVDTEQVFSSIRCSFPLIAVPLNWREQEIVTAMRGSPPNVDYERFRALGGVDFVHKSFLQFASDSAHFYKERNRVLLRLKKQEISMLHQYHGGMSSIPCYILGEMTKDGKSIRVEKQHVLLQGPHVLGFSTGPYNVQFFLPVELNFEAGAQCYFSLKKLSKLKKELKASSSVVPPFLLLEEPQNSSEKQKKRSREEKDTSKKRQRLNPEVENNFQLPVFKPIQEAIKIPTHSSQALPLLPEDSMSCLWKNVGINTILKVENEAIQRKSVEAPTTEQVREFLNDLLANEAKWLSLLETSANGWCFFSSDELFDYLVQCKARFESQYPHVDSREVLGEAIGFFPMIEASYSDQDRFRKLCGRSISFVHNYVKGFAREANNFNKQRNRLLLQLKRQEVATLTQFTGQIRTLPCYILGNIAEDRKSIDVEQGSALFYGSELLGFAKDTLDVFCGGGQLRFVQTEAFSQQAFSLQQLSELKNELEQSDEPSFLIVQEPNHQQPVRRSAFKPVQKAINLLPEDSMSSLWKNLSINTVLKMEHQLKKV